MGVDMTMITNVFQQSRLHLFNKQSGLQTPLNHVLNKVADQSIETKQKNTDNTLKEKIKDIEVDKYTKTLNSESLEDLNPKLLEYYAKCLEFYSGLSNDREQELNSFKEQLMSYDQGIQTFQDILSGKENLPDGVTMDDINQLLTKTQQARDKYLKDGCKKLNKWDLYDDSINHIVNILFGENKLTKSDMENLKFDSSAPDIYAEIDKAIEATRNVSHTIHKGMSRIYDILEKKGYERYKLHQSVLQEDKNPAPDTKNVNPLQLFLSSLKSEASKQAK